MNSPRPSENPAARVAGIPFGSSIPGGAGLIALSISCAGCAVNDHGLVSTRLYENDTAYVLHLEAWGGHLITNTVDGGLTIGRSRRWYVYPKARRAGSALRGAPVLPGDGRARLREVRGSAAPAGPGASRDPVALVTVDTGLALHLNRLRTGLLLGARAASTLLLPRDFDGVFLFRYASENTHDTKVYYLERGYP